jgi:peptidoglycan/xylan/chitin deacetylase (PgdA/CDA1 family)
LSSTTQSVRRALGRMPAAQLAYRGVLRGRLEAERWALTARNPGSRRARILAYHSIGTPRWGANDVRPRDFERHLQIAVDDGWTFTTPADVLARPDEQLLALTFDDGALSVLHNAVPVLRAHGVPATMFVVTDWADGHHEAGFDEVMGWRELAQLQRWGWTLASHSATHPDFAGLDAGEARRQLEVSRERLREVVGVETEDFAIPFGQSSNWSDVAALAAKEAGYSQVYAQSVDTRPVGTLPRTFITRIDRPAVFRAALGGAFDGWEEWFLLPR